MNQNLYELTNPQKSIWFTEEYFKGTSMENICGSVISPKKINFEILEKAINKFVELNDSFRLKFILGNGNLKQFVDIAKPFSIEKIKLHCKKDLEDVERTLCDTPFEIINSCLSIFKLLEFDDGHGGFIICIHHLISDAWTTGFGASEIIKIYSELLKNENTKFEPNPTYIDYIATEKDYLSSPKFEADKSFWLEKYASIPEVATIPSLNKNSEKSSSIANRQEFKLPTKFSETLNSYCKENKFSIFNLFMAVLAVYVGRVANLDDFVLGSPILNRTNFKEKHTTGMFISTVPLRVNINHEEKFTNFVSQIARDFFNIFKHQKYPYQYLLEELRKQENVPNLYNIMLSYQNIRSSAQNDETPYEIHWVPNKYTADNIDIHLYDMNDTGSITVAYDYQISKYSKEEIIATHNRLIHIIEQIVENSSVCLKDIEIVTPSEKNQILNEFNNTKTDYPKDKTISQLFEEQVEKSPDNIAVVFEDQKLTYKELNEKANSLAHYLLEKGIINNNIVGIMVNRSLEMIIGILAILKSGNAYLPIDPEYPEDRINYMLENSNTKLLLSQKKLENKLSSKIDTVFIDLNNSNVYSLSIKNLPCEAKLDSLAYLIYTSGSTGLPKGVMLKNISLSNLTNYCNNYTEYLKFNTYRSIVSVTTVSFDIFIFETLISLQKGLKLVIANENEQVNPRLLNMLMERENVEIIQTTPSRMQLLVNNINDIPFLKNLRFITLAGEPLPINLAKQLKKISNVKIYNGYGPSETTVFSTYTDVTNHEFITIGKPLDNTYIYILDSTSNLCPIGFIGELCISGDGVGAGYINNNKLTNKSFTTDKFFNGKIMYKTGDLGYYLPNGEIVCVGRADNQIKIRGLRIELEEIEKKILNFETINNCVVTKKVDQNSHEFLCAYYIANKNVDIAKIREMLNKNLPRYMVPQYFVQLEQLPYTPNGKIDRKKLPMPSESICKEIVLPRNNTDKELISILMDLLNISSISINDSFFDLGGDSLTAINLSTQIYAKLSVEVFVKDIVQNPIIMDLSDYISLIKTTVIKKNIIEPVKTANSYPVSSSQRRMYLASSVAGNDSTLYNISGGIILNKAISIKKLENCFNILIKRHESLRTYFELENNSVVQKIKENIDFVLKHENLKDNNKLEDCFRNFVKPFDLSVAPLLRAKIISLPNKNCALFIDMHHIISDGTSMSILIDELCKLYNGNSLADLKITYKDFAAFENNELTSGNLTESENYWLNTFSGELPVLDIPTIFSRPAVQSFEGKKVYFNIDKNLTNAINDCSKKLATTPYMLLLATYYILLYKYSMQNDIIVGTPIVGRNIADTYSLIGMFVNTLALRSKIDSKTSFKDYMNTIKDLCLNSYKYQTYPFDELVNKLNLKRDTSRNPLFDTMFIYQNNGNPDITFDGIDAKYYIPDNNISKFDLSLEIIPNEDGLALSFEYCTKLFDNEFVQRLSTHYINILNAVLNNIDISIANIDMLSEEEKNTILYKFNATKYDYQKDKTISQIFEEQAEKNPNNVAIVFENKQLSYKELNEKANSLAHYLRENGIGRNDVVGICLNRSFELIISIMAVLKAGGLYVLIDTEFPNDRKKYILTNSNAKLLIISNNIDIDYFQKLILDNSLLKNNFENINCINSLSDNFAIIYTSGSTGLPKGALLHQKGLLNLLYSYINVIDICQANSNLGLAAVTFDMFAVELFTAILLGRTLYLLNEEEQKNPVLTSNIIQENKIEFTVTTPTKIELLLSSPDTAKCLQYLKRIQLGGEVFNSNLYCRLSKYTDANIFNGYGPTEITACCSNKLVTDSSDINIGKPNPNTKIYILDKDLNICPINTPGEIFVAGDGVSNGYINNAEKTSQSFVYNKFDDSIMYKTGDIAKYLKNGDIDYIGRNDFQIKLHGLRIELAEIENQILTLDYIKNCVVIPDKSNTFLKAFFVATDTLSVPKIREKLLSILPAYMIPKYFLQIDNIPYTTNGKVDKVILDAYKIEISDENTPYTAPENELQELLCSLWEAILKTKVGIDNDLFELGADSLSAIQFKVDALNNNIDISYADIFKYKTIRKLSELKNISINTNKIDEYDYDNINAILAKPIKRFNSIVSQNNNVLLLGSNGFVGMHILASFIKNDTGNIYCIIRSKNGESALDRFMSILHFYFQDSLDKYINNRIFIYEGDVIKQNLGLSDTDLNIIANSINTVINSAANVKHFGDFDKFKSINIDATINIIDFCKQYKKRLIHLSTLSISGNMFIDGSISIDRLQKHKKFYFTEHNLFINQSLDNVYTRSKFEAERLILENTINNLDAQILRLGNITSRFADGVFQKNVLENAFASRLRSLALLGYIPKSLLEQPVEFTPVDLCADAIITVLQNKDANLKILHIYNRNHVKLYKIVNIFKKANKRIKIVNDDDFANQISIILKDSKLRKNLDGIINDLSKNKKLDYYSNIYIKSDLSYKFLASCHFKWPEINNLYLKKYINYLKSINFFKEEN